MMMGPIIYSSCAASDNFLDNNVWPCILCKYQILCSTRSEWSFPGNKIMCLNTRYKVSNCISLIFKLFWILIHLEFLALHCGHVIESFLISHTKLWILKTDCCFLMILSVVFCPLTRRSILGSDGMMTNWMTYNWLMADWLLTGCWLISDWSLEDLS